MGFDASVVTGLDFNFRPFVEVSGVTPDPSEEMVRTFFSRIEQITQKAARARDEILKVNDDGQDVEITDEMLAAIDAVLATHHEENLDALADLCGGEPTREQIGQLPFRVQKAFLKSLQEELADPTTRPATRPPLAVAR